MAGVGEACDFEAFLRARFKQHTVAVTVAARDESTSTTRRRGSIQMGIKICPGGVDL